MQFQAGVLFSERISISAFAAETHCHCRAHATTCARLPSRTWATRKPDLIAALRPSTGVCSSHLPGGRRREYPAQLSKLPNPAFFRNMRMAGGEMLQVELEILPAPSLLPSSWLSLSRSGARVRASRTAQTTASTVTELGTPLMSRR